MDTDKTIVENTQFNAQNSPGNLRQKSSNNSDELIRKLNQELQYKKVRCFAGCHSGHNTT